MKKRMKQLMAVMLSVALCVPAIPGAYGYAATSGTTFTQEEEIALSGLGSERSTLFNDDGNFPFLILPVQKAPLSMTVPGMP